jgi:hypothetical protein
MKSFSNPGEDSMEASEHWDPASIPLCNSAITEPSAVARDASGYLTLND